jgi:hypothetical protein
MRIFLPDFLNLVKNPTGIRDFPLVLSAWPAEEVQKLELLHLYLSCGIACGTARDRTTTLPALCSDRDYVISQLMLEESCHCITAWVMQYNLASESRVPVILEIEWRRILRAIWRSRLLPPKREAELSNS